MSTFEEAKALLEKEGTATGASVFDHLSGVILKILNESPDDPVATFEALSILSNKVRIFKNQAKALSFLCQMMQKQHRLQQRTRR
jgi:hypothetical protein